MRVSELSGLLLLPIPQETSVIPAFTFFYFFLLHKPAVDRSRVPREWIPTLKNVHATNAYEPKTNHLID